jgi:SpoVK/Ycf46/Vps4 family AAA+-type ATPase
MLVSPNPFSHNPQIEVEVMSKEREGAEVFLQKLTRATRYGKAFRGNVLSLDGDCYGNISVHFHRLPKISREEIILSESLLKRIERHTISFGRHVEALQKSGRHLKRGILLYGPPGTGKTLSAMYLASQMKDRTVLVITGAGMGSIERACGLARLLEPSTIILEDVDLIGTQRDDQTVNANVLLFEMLNQMDGLADDTDILFVLTTNRPDVLEPALASRPGRVDQAIQIPLPDASCRRRLFDLYSKGLKLQITNLDGIIDRTRGVSGAFIRELLRKAALFAAEDNPGEEFVVEDRHVDEALAELLILGGELTQSLLGAQVGKEEKNPPRECP